MTSAKMESGCGKRLRCGLSGRSVSLALHTQAVLQGAFILAKANGGPEIAAESVDHLIRYLELLFLPDR